MKEGEGLRGGKKQGDEAALERKQHFSGISVDREADRHNNRDGAQSSERKEKWVSNSYNHGNLGKRENSKMKRVHSGSNCRAEGGTTRYV